MNPIIVKNEKGEKVKFIQFDYDVNGYSQPLKVEIHNCNGNILFNDYLNSDTVLSINQKDALIDIYYKNKNGEILFVQHEDLYKVIPMKHSLVSSDDDEEVLIKELKIIVMNSLDRIGDSEQEKKFHTEMLKNTTSKPEARTYVTSKIRECIEKSSYGRKLSRTKIDEYTYRIYADFYGMGVIQELDDRNDIQEILVNAVDFPVFSCQIYYYWKGKKYQYTKRNFTSIEEVMKVFQRSVDFANEELNKSTKSRVEAIRANKDRVTVIIPTSSENYSLNIRKFSCFTPNPKMMKEVGTVNDELESILYPFVVGKANIGIGGPMGTGKTTFINYLLTYTEPIERKVVIASVSETDTQRVLKGHDIVVLNVNEEKGNTFTELIKTSLRTTASRVIIPESRGSEFKQVYEANVKTQGNMFTAHALKADSFLDMCTDMYMEGCTNSNENSEYVKDKLAKNINIIIIMRNVDGKIRLDSLNEVIVKNGKYAGLNLLYHLEIDEEDTTKCWYVRDNKISDDLRKFLNDNGVPKSALAHL